MVYSRSVLPIFLFFVFSCVTEKQNGNISYFFTGNSYPIKINVQKAQYFTSLNINYQNVRMSFSEGRMAPIEIDAGITGLVIFARGSILHFNNSDLTKKTYWVSDYILFRFNPEHYAGIIAGNEFTMDSGSIKEDDVWSVMEKYFGFAFCNGMEAIIPDHGSYGLKTDRVSIVFNAKKSENTVVP